MNAFNWQPELNGTALVLGLGVSGCACARYLQERDLPFVLADGRAEPASLPELIEQLGQTPEFRLATDAPEAVLAGIGHVIASPGVPLDSALLLAAKAAGLPIVGDVELFARELQQSGLPVVAITGSNGKSTVTTWVADVLEAAGYRVAVGGNLGEPVLALLPTLDQPADTAPQVYVVELSSFQLDTTYSLQPTAATVLNVSPDHMDRYSGLDAYAASKQSIFGKNRNTVAIINADDDLVMAMPTPPVSLRFASERRADVDYAIDRLDGQAWLFRGAKPVLAASELHVAGRHNQLNALAVIALVDALPLQVSDEALLSSLRSFGGLPHRTQWVGGSLGVDWYNDSKATNVGATLAALAGMAGPLWLLAGGDGKQQDFAPLCDGLDERIRGIALFGQDANDIQAALQNAVRVQSGDLQIARLANLDDAVAWCAEQSVAGDQVLLSPACASFDQFPGYVARGEAFVAAVRALEGPA